MRCARAAVHQDLLLRRVRFDCARRGHAASIEAAVIHVYLGISLERNLRSSQGAARPKGHAAGRGSLPTGKLSLMACLSSRRAP